MLASGATARTGAVAAVYEPVAFGTLSEEQAAGLQYTIARIGDTVASGQLADAVRMFAEPLVNQDELAAVSASGYFEATWLYIPVFLREIEQPAQSHGYIPTDPSVLALITVPVLLMYGSHSALGSWFAAGVRHVAEHVAAPRVQEITGTGNCAPILRAKPNGNELMRFFGAEAASA